jgi:hypothetical protein
MGILVEESALARFMEMDGCLLRIIRGGRVATDVGLWRLQHRRERSASPAASTHGAI